MTKTWHVCEDTTIAAINDLLKSSTMRDVAERLLGSRQLNSTVSMITHRKPGGISVQKERQIREMLGLPNAPLLPKKAELIPGASNGITMYPRGERLVIVFVPQPDPRDTRIAELERALEAALAQNGHTAEAQP